MTNPDAMNRFDRARAVKDAHTKKSFTSTWVTIQNLYRPARISADQAGRVYVILSLLANPKEILRLSAGTTDALIAEIKKQFGAAAVFSNVEPRIETPVSRARAAVDAEKVEREQALADERFIREQVEAYRTLCQSMTPEERETQWRGLAIEMVKKDSLPNDFFSWPIEDNKSTFKNYEIWKQICHGLGLPQKCVPAMFEGRAAFQYGQQHDHFFQRDYKRSETYLRNQVQPVDATKMQDSREDLRASAIRKVNAARLPAGTRIDQRRAELIGLTPEEFEAMVTHVDAERSRDFMELKRDVQAARPVRSRRELMKGY